MLYEFPDRLPPVPRLPQEATCYRGLVYMPYRNTSWTTAGLTSSTTGTRSIQTEDIARLQWPLLPKPSFFSVRTFASMLHGLRWTGFEGGPYKALQPPHTAYSVVVFDNTTSLKPYVPQFTSHGTPSIRRDSAELWIVRISEATKRSTTTLTDSELILPQPCHSLSVECCCELTSHLGNRSIVRSVDGCLKLPWQPNDTLAFLRAVHC